MVDPSLDRYRRRRDFGRTPEPPGGMPPAGGMLPAAGARRFVVQRHRARRLHYDLRLEMDGVLASWAVPRGPTLDPDARRMAIHVEDHPLEYLDFEGVIPERQYGAGDVIVWDRGTYEPEGTGDPGAAVRGGELKFRLHGQKLAGRYTLVRTGRPLPGSGTDPERGWLLIKKRDEWAVPGWDTEAHPRSVTSGRTNDDVAAGAPGAWTSGAQPSATESSGAAVGLPPAPGAPMPGFIEPMQATLAAAPFSDPDWLFEIKWDGYRVEAVVREGKVRLWTRHRQDAARYFPSLAGPPSWIAAQEAIVDGEVVALRPDGTADFGMLQDLAGVKGPRPGRPARAGVPGESRDAVALAYEVFDLLHLDGRSLLDVPLEDRKRLLRAVLRPHPVVRYAAHVETDGAAFFEAAAALGVEGIVAKLRRSRYEPGRRSRAWLKLKSRPEQELVVGGYVPGRGRSADLGALVVGVHEDGVLRHAGRVGSGFDEGTRSMLLGRLEPIRRADPPFADPPRLPAARWVEPRLVIRAAFAEWTAGGLVRQAAFKGLEPDRDPATVMRERAIRQRRRSRRDAPGDGAAAHATTAPHATAAPLPASATGGVEAATPDELAALEAMPARGGHWEVGGRRVSLTHLDRVLFPAAGLTKRDLIRYYVTIAPVLLPYLAGRALNLSRWPDGVDGPHFWQRQVPDWAPAWITRRHLAGHAPRDSHTYAVADSVATLAWLANQAAIELHPWTSLADTPERPTFALIDVDPGEHTAWEETVLLARLYGEALRHLGVTGYPKTTGRRGIQVWIPVRPVYTFDQTRAWVEQVSRAVGAAAPDLVSWEWGKTARGGRARLDYTQNAMNRTLVGPYVVRARPNASVSAPISWDELDDPDLRSDRWTIETIGSRLAARGDLFRGVLGPGQELPAL